jgi:hypothetical protein
VDHPALRLVTDGSGYLDDVVVHASSSGSSSAPSSLASSSLASSSLASSSLASSGGTPH